MELSHSLKFLKSMINIKGSWKMTDKLKSFDAMNDLIKKNKAR